ncbi:hypothetical protein L1987_49022 [Smallanthus sonchifolius]|uniref:Uncharacterized protein n=1 Tax=Smallanthus sonchifolius TaxID=185202 RepID=A0ACB9FUH7_9ASTR|nr:hypothetical protein L1987_49022 [Smallanthus sonchifolius]
MKGYSKINLINTTSKSKSMDSSDQTIKKSTSTVTQEQPKTLADDDYDYNHYSGNNNNQEQDGNFPTEKMRINRSVSSHGTTTDANSTSNLSGRFKIEKQHSTGRTLQAAVKRAMSIRRSASVSEGYSRIHDQGSNLFDVDDHDEELQMKNVKKRSLFKACKRVFGF